MTRSGRVTADQSPRAGRCLLAVLEHHLATDNDVINTIRLCRRFFERGPVEHGFGIEHGNIGDGAGPDDSTIAETETLAVCPVILWTAVSSGNSFS